ncbi:protein artichoke-like [Apis laboriosa]|uniref:protein artichoke-like n=1 Tax=Apis laboriosa TaxID=183418 RepID=UPI001CC74ED0|nr:protein artichoke-like [Apis laboriosa]
MIYLYLIGFYFLWIIQNSICSICLICSCSVNKELQINCHGKYLKNNDMLNFDLLNNYQELNKLILSKNNIIDLPKNFLKKLKYLKNLDLSENNIEKIYITMFIDLNNLEDLNLSKNVLRTFDNSLLEILPTMMSLNLSYNYINSIEHTMNQTILKINMLDLSHNNISSLPKKFSELLINLQYLDLSFNRIQSLQDCNLIHLNSLKVLYVNNNFLVTLNMQILPKTLVKLYIGYNQIMEINNLSHIEVLSIEHNKISQLYNNLIVDSLQYMNISGNILSSFPNILFKNLKILDISNNKFTYIPKVISIKNFPLLLQLKVNKNPIQNLTILSDLKLNSFDASDINKLKSIEKDTLANLRSLSKNCINITISNNKMLTFIHEDALKHMNLCSLDLSNNQFSYVARKLIVHNNSLSTYNINLQGNPFKCNCTLQWMLNDLIPKLYIVQPHLLDDLRCSWPTQISNMRMVHWYGWKNQVFCNTSINENLSINVASIITTEIIKLDSSPGLLVIVGIATTVLTILILTGIIWTQRIAIKRRRVNRKF